MLIGLGLLLCLGIFYKSVFAFNNFAFTGIVVVLWQITYLVQFIQLKWVDYGANFEGSIYKMLAYGLIPLIILFLSMVFIAIQKSSVKYLLISISFFLVVNVVLLPLGLGEDSAFLIYGNEVVAEWGGIRLSLPSFPGVVSGAVFAGLVSVVAVCFIKKRKLLFGVILAASLYVVIKTETRSVLLLTMIFLLTILIVDQKEIIRRWRIILIFVFFGAFSLPYLTYTFANVAYALPVDAQMDMFTRKGEYGFFQFGGRAEMWEGLISGYEPSVWQFLFGYGPIGEYSSGNSAWIAEQTGHFKNTPEVLHSHNAWLNLLYCGGIAYVLIVVVAIAGVAKRLVYSAKNNPLQVEYYAGFMGIVFLMACASTESVFSIHYIYFTPFVVITYAFNRYDECVCSV